MSLKLPLHNIGDALFAKAHEDLSGSKSWSTTFPTRAFMAQNLHSVTSPSVLLGLDSFESLFTKSGRGIQLGIKVKPTVLLALWALVLILVVLAVAIRRLFFHPLAAYPGPFLAAVTDWYSVYHCYIGDRHLDFHRLHCQYGKVVRYGPNRISINSVDALKEIYSVNANVQKSRIFSIFVHFFKSPMSMVTVDRKEHAFKRRVNSKALTSHAIKRLEGTLLENISTFCQKMLGNESEDCWNEARDMSKWISYLTSDIMGNVAFGRNWNVMKSDENRKVVEALPQGVAGLLTCGHMPSILTLKLDKLLFRKLVAEAHRFQALSKAQAEWRMKRDNDLDVTTKDIFSALQEARDPETGRGYTQEELIAEAGLLIIAGSDTTATAISSTIFYLLHFPSSYLRLQREIFATFSSLEEICLGNQLSSCTYLTACLDEALRLSPPVPGLLPREALPGGLVLSDLSSSVPSGIDVGVPIYALHHDASYFTDPFTYIPERWLVKDEVYSAESIQRARDAFCAFGIGRTSCVGKQLAYAEMELTLARVIWIYEMRLKPGENRGSGWKGRGWGRERAAEFQLWDKFVSTSEGPLVEFKRRVKGDAGEH